MAFYDFVDRTLDREGGQRDLLDKLNEVLREIESGKDDIYGSASQDIATSLRGGHPTLRRTIEDVRRYLAPDKEAIFTTLVDIWINENRERIEFVMRQGKVSRDEAPNNIDQILDQIPEYLSTITIDQKKKEEMVAYGEDYRARESLTLGANYRLKLIESVGRGYTISSLQVAREILETGSIDIEKFIMCCATIQNEYGKGAPKTTYTHKEIKKRLRPELQNLQLDQTKRADLEYRHRNLGTTTRTTAVSIYLLVLMERLIAANSIDTVAIAIELQRGRGFLDIKKFLSDCEQVNTLYCLHGVSTIVADSDGPLRRILKAVRIIK